VLVIILNCFISIIVGAFGLLPSFIQDQQSHRRRIVVENIHSCPVVKVIQPGKYELKLENYNLILIRIFYKTHPNKKPKTQKLKTEKRQKMQGRLGFKCILHGPHKGG
jgi:hypothetical protein